MAGGRARPKRTALLIGVFLVATFLNFLQAPGQMTRAKAAFPGRNGRIVFEVSTRPVRPVATTWLLSDFDLFAVRPGGDGLHQLNQGPEMDLHPVWSPDGSHIAFTRAATYQGDASDIWVMNADGSDARNLTNTPLAYENHASWSPDGTQLVFRSFDDDAGLIGYADLYIIDLDGSDRTRLTSDDVNEAFPAWSPDGEWIVYRQGDEPARWMLITPDGTRRKQLVSAEDLNGELVRFPDWSPDSRRLVFLAGPSEGAGGLSWSPDIWIVNADGSNLQRVTSDADHTGVSWSPDGRKLAVGVGEDDSFRLYTMNPDGSRPRQVLSLDITAPADPDWGPR